MNRPVESVCVAFAVGCAWLQWQTHLLSSFTIGLFLSLAWASLGFVYYAKGLPCARDLSARQWPVAISWLRWAALCIAATLLGASYSNSRATWRLSDQLAASLENQEISLTVRVNALPIRSAAGIRFEALTLVAPPGVPQHLMLAWYGNPNSLKPPDVQVGQTWQVNAKLRRPHGNLNPEGFDAESWLLQQGLRASGSIRSAHAVPVAANCWAAVYLPFECLREHLRNEMLSVLAGLPYAGVIIALVIGDQSNISAAQWLIFNQAGIGHLVSISGLHITMLAGLFATVAGACWRRLSWGRWAAAQHFPTPLIAAITACLSALLYSLLAGWGVPARRTFWMLWTIVGLRCLGRPLKPVYVLAIALLVVVLADPWAPLAPGFWLSFAAVAFIFFVSAGHVDLQRYRRRAAGTGETLLTLMRSGVRVQAAITLGLAPLTVVLFQQLSLIGPLANAVAIPVVSFVVTPLALLGTVLIATPLASPLLGLAQWTMMQLMHGIEPMVAWPIAVWTVPAAPWWWAAWATLGLLWMWGPPTWPARWVAWTLCLPLLTYRPPAPPEGGWRLTAFDVGQGSAILFETGDYRLLFDTGPKIGLDTDAGDRVIVPYLRAYGLQGLNDLIVSHEDADHAGGAEAVLRFARVQRFWSSNETYLASVQANPRHTLQRLTCHAPISWTAGAWRLRFLHPPATVQNLSEVLKTSNARSCVLLIEPSTAAVPGAPRPGSVLLTGDIESSQENGLLATGLPPVDIVLVPHHGSKTSSTPSFVTALQSRVAIMQVGYLNRYHHPAPGVQARWENNGARVYRSDRDGAVQLTFAPAASGPTLHVTSARDSQHRYWHGQ